jgi:SAM-dependent methyltransferase
MVATAWDVLHRHRLAGLVDADGTVHNLDVDRWHHDADAVERQLLRGVDSPVLDVGCGPARHVAALHGAGVDALGVDVAATAVRLARRRALPVFHGCVFDTLPRAGQWGTALLLDGNVGIGGDPRRLLDRVAQLLRPRGLALVELDPPGAPTGPLQMRIPGHGRCAWARVGADAVAPIAAAAGFTVEELVERGGRWFTWLRVR